MTLSYILNIDMNIYDCGTWKLILLFILKTVSYFRFY